jgi:hypothetical protein
MKTSDSKRRSKKKGHPSAKIPALRTNQELVPKVRSETDQPQCWHTLQQSHNIHMISSGESHTAFTKLFSQSCGKCSNYSITVQPSIRSQQCPSTRESFISQYSCAQDADYLPTLTDQQRKEFQMPMVTDPYSSIERWEAQVPAEDAWSTCVVLESGRGAREPICENSDMMRELAIQGL